MALHTSADAPITCAYWDELCDEDGFLALGRNRYHCSYVIYTDGTYYYAENGTTGNLDYGGPNNLGGATGTNASTVIQAVITALVNGGKIFFKRGTYTLMATMIVNRDNLAFIGEAASLVTFVLPTAAVGFRIYNSYITFQGIKFQGTACTYWFYAHDFDTLTRDITWRDNTFTGSGALYVFAFLADDARMANRMNLIWDNNLFESLSTTGSNNEIIRVAGYNVTIKNNVFKDVSTNRSIRIHGGKNIFVTQNSWLDFKAQTDNSTCLTLVSTYILENAVIALNNFVWTENSVLKVASAIGVTQLVTGTIDYPKNVSIIGNTVKSTNTFDQIWIGIYLHSHGVQNIEKLAVIGNTINGVYESGIQTVCIKDTDISGNVISDTGLHGIRLNGSAGNTGNILVENNIISNVNNRVGLGYGIIMDANSPTNKITNNVITDSVPNQVNAIYEEAGANNNIITDNRVSGATGATIVQNGAATKVLRNQGFTTENSGTGAVIAAADTSIVVAHGCDYTPSALDVSVVLTNLPTNDIGDVYVDTFGAANFTIHCRNVPGAATAIFNWAVRRV